MILRWIIGLSLWLLLLMLARSIWEARRAGLPATSGSLLLVVAIATVGGAVGAWMPA